MVPARSRPFADQPPFPQGEARGAALAPNVGDNYVFMPSRTNSQERIGIYARGGCHLHALFACAPLVRSVARQTCCIYHDGLVAHGRSDLELQTLQGLPPEWTGPATEKLHLGHDYFQPRLFEKTLVVPGHEYLGQFPKTVVIISIGSDSAGRRLYRHREHGFLVDPGGGWLKSLESTLNDLTAVTWFRQQFESIGLISLDAFVENFTKVIQLLRANTTKHVLVFNTLTLEPGNTTHNYQFVKHSDTMRWRRFNIALMELSRQLDFPIVDLDRIVRRYGMRGQRAAAHFPPQLDLLLGREAFRIMDEMGVFKALQR
jgi:hypothetical protein